MPLASFASLLLVPHIIAARKLLAECESGMSQMEITVPIKTDTSQQPCFEPFIEEIAQAVCNIEFSMKKCVQLKQITEKTHNLIQFLRAVDVDYTLLMYLQMSESVTKGKAFVAYLQGICEQHGISYTNPLFFDAVWSYFKQSGVQSITPTKFLVNRRKEDLLEEYKTIRMRNDWTQHNPFIFQTFVSVEGRGFQKLVFFITRTWQDGVIRIRDILKHGGFVHGTTMFDAHGVFEHVMDDESLACLILDSEILANAMPGDASMLSQDILAFPSIIGAEMVQKGLINEEDMLRVVVKDRSRPRGDTTKISFHFLLNVCALKSHHKQAIEICMGDYKETIAAGLTHLKTQGLLPEDRPLQAAWYAFDAKAAISNGFTTAFSRKTKSDPFSRKHSDKVICAGMQIQETLCLIQEQDFEHLNEKDQLWLLQDQLYTTPKRYMLNYAMHFDEDKVIILFNFLSLPLGFEP